MQTQKWVKIEMNMEIASIENATVFIRSNSSPLCHIVTPAINAKAKNPDFLEILSTVELP